jgi:hypothetical protein
VFKAHKAVLGSKSTWFAERCYSHPDIYEEGVPPETLKLFKHNRIVPCGEHKESIIETGKCVPWAYFQLLLKFCYTSQYVLTDLDATGLNCKDQCMSHIYMYMLGKIYGVNDVLPHAISGFVEKARIVRKTDNDSLIQFINLIYDLPDLDTNDALRKEARNQAQFIADTASIPIRQSLFSKELRCEVVRLMPKAGVDLFANGYEPSTTPSFPDSGKTCTRCYTPLDQAEISSSRFCQDCVSARMESCSVFVAEPYTGISMAFWKCFGCLEIWRGEGLKRQNLSLEECPACEIPSKPRTRSKRVLRYVAWTCAGCMMLWKAQTVALEEFNIEKCICCPTKDR